MKLMITDVSVLYDLYQLGILPEFFALKVEISTTSFVYNEIVVTHHINDFEVYNKLQKLNIIILSEEEQEAVNKFVTKRNLKSLPDKTMLWKSIQLNCTLLTCERKLKLEAIDYGIEVHGSVWIIEKMIKENILAPLKAIELLEQLKMENERLPMEEIEKLIKTLRNAEIVV